MRSGTAAGAAGIPSLFQLVSRRYEKAVDDLYLKQIFQRMGRSGLVTGHSQCDTGPGACIMNHAEHPWGIVPDEGEENGRNVISRPIGHREGDDYK